MPTGYTNVIADGVTFQQYALRCARAFGALMHMRDESMDAEIPDEFKPSTYHEDKLKESLEEKNRLLSLTEQEKVDNTLKHNNDKLHEYRKQKKETIELRSKYNNMLTQCRIYQPPTEDHVEFKNFMISQIEVSIGSDCYPATKPKELSAEEHYNSQLKEVEWCIEYHTKNLNEEKERCVTKTAWITALKKSIGI